MHEKASTSVEKARVRLQIALPMFLKHSKTQGDSSSVASIQLCSRKSIVGQLTLNSLNCQSRLEVCTRPEVIARRTHNHLFGATIAKLALSSARVAEAGANQGTPLEKVVGRVLESRGSGNGVGEDAQSHCGEDEDGGLELHLSRSEVK